MSVYSTEGIAFSQFKSRWKWLIPLASVAGIVWVINALINLLGQATILRAGLTVQNDSGWMIGMLIVRLVLYSVTIVALRKHLANHQFNNTEIKAGTWMMVRVCVLYELLFGLKVLSLLGQFINSSY